MIGIIDRVSENIASSCDYKKDKDLLFSKYVAYISGKSPDIERDVVKRLLLTAQYFCKSTEISYRDEGVTTLSMLVDIAGNKYKDLIPVARKVFIDSGDFPNVSLLERRFSDSKMSYGFFSEAIFEFKERLNSIDILNYPLTDYQRLLWHKLEQDEDVITVAPTSAGKTHIILTYLVRKVLESSEGAFAAIIVPTRALISEVSSKVYDISNDFGGSEKVEICTVSRDEKQFNDKTIFVMTQERLYELIQAGDMAFNYLFIDEAQNISDKSRGVLLHLTLEKLLESSLPQIIVSMPSESYRNAFTSVFSEVEFHQEVTRHSPVAKILISVKLVNRDIVLSRFDSESVVKVKKEFTGTKLADVVMQLGAGESNIIYRNQTNYCEKIADDIAERIENFDTSKELDEAADYIEKFVHEDFSLASNLRKGVAFHYGPLPSSVRIMIENLVKLGQIKYIACTSTLAEGVNLPAKNLFLENPVQKIVGQPSGRLEDVKIKNITGRAGRMLEHFSGNVFLYKHENWDFKDYFQEEDSEKKIPTYYQTLNDEFDSVVAALSGAYSHSDSEQYRFYTIANKLIKEYSNNQLDDTFNSNDLNLSPTEISELRRAVTTAYRSVKVAPFTLEANPTVGYIQQNKLFDFLTSLADFDDWVLPHPKSSNLYTVLVRVLTKISELGVFNKSDEYTIEHISSIGKKWVSGMSLRDMIVEQISWDKSNLGSSNVNKSVRDVIKIINNDITFRMRNALSCYQLLLTSILTQRSIIKANVKLHTYLEIGAHEKNMVNLINMGLSRESAKEVHDFINDKVFISTVQDLKNVIGNVGLDDLHPVTKREIQELIT